MATPVAVSQQSDMERVAAQVDRSPTPAQKEAGNYKKGHMLWRGLSIAIENPAFSQRSKGNWSVTLPYHYGYIKRTIGADGDQVDVMIGPDLKSTRIFVVDQRNPKTDAFDETKVFIGYNHFADVENAYDAGFSDGSGPRRRMAVSEISLGAFRRWLRNGDTTEPYSPTLKKAYDPNEPRDTGGKWMRDKGGRKRQLMARQNGNCAYCGGQMTLVAGQPNTISIEHIIPRSAGGAKRGKNVIGACTKCNNDRLNGPQPEYHPNANLPPTTRRYNPNDPTHNKKLQLKKSNPYHDKDGKFTSKDGNVKGQIIAGAAAGLVTLAAAPVVTLAAAAGKTAYHDTRNSPWFGQKTSFKEVKRTLLDSAKRTGLENAIVTSKDWKNLGNKTGNTHSVHMPMTGILKDTFNFHSHPGKRFSPPSPQDIAVKTRNLANGGHGVVVSANGSTYFHGIGPKKANLREVGQSYNKMMNVLVSDILDVAKKHKELKLPKVSTKKEVKAADKKMKGVKKLVTEIDNLNNVIKAHAELQGVAQHAILVGHRDAGTLHYRFHLSNADKKLLAKYPKTFESIRSMAEIAGRNIAADKSINYDHLIGNVIRGIGAVGVHAGVLAAQAVRYIKSDETDGLEKYNHNHGEHGHFASGNMYGKDVPDEVRQQYEEELNAGGVNLGSRNYQSKPKKTKRTYTPRSSGRSINPFVVAGLGGVGAGLLVAGAGKLAEHLLRKDWDESKHPRDNKGQFSHSGNTVYFRGSKDINTAVTPEHWNAVYLTTSKKKALFYSSPSWHGGNRDTSGINTYTLKPGAKFLDMKNKDNNHVKKVLEDAIANDHYRKQAFSDIGDAAKYGLDPKEIRTSFLTDYASDLHLKPTDGFKDSVKKLGYHGTKFGNEIAVHDTSILNLVRGVKLNDIVKLGLKNGLKLVKDEDGDEGGYAPVAQTKLVTGADSFSLDPSQRLKNWRKRMQLMRYRMKKSLQDDKYIVNLAVDKEVLLKAGEKLSERILGKASLSPDEIASGIEAGLGSGLASFFTWLNGKPANDVSQAAAQYDPTAAADALNTDEFNTRLNESLNPLDNAFAGGVRYASNSNMPPPNQGPQIRVAFNTGSAYTQQALDNYKAKLAGDISQSQQDTIQGIIVDGTNKGLSPAQMAQSIRDVIGLTPNQAQNVVDYRNALENINDPGNAENVFGRQLRDQRYDRVVQQAVATGKDIPPAQVDKMVDAYKRRYIAYRAMNIARTESMKAVNLGAIAAAEDYADLNNLDIVKKWIATMDNRTRKEHRELNGQEIVGIDNPFTVSDGRTILYPHDPDADPELTVNCRCTLGLSYVPKQDQSDEEDVSG